MTHPFLRTTFAALAVVVLSVPLMANAAAVTQLIHFDDAKNGWKWYSDKDLNFLFDPTNLQSSTLCADSTNGGNGSCVIEGTQNVLPEMTRPENGPTIQGSANKEPIVSGTDQSFTLDAFYFLLTGNGEGAANAITASGSNGSTFTFQLDGDYPGPLTTSPVVSFYEGPDAGDPAGKLVKQTGYVATFGDLFKDVAWIQFSAPSTAQVRLDCVVATFDGTTTEPLSRFTAGCGAGGTDFFVPEPASLALLGAGLLLVAFARRPRKS